MKPLLRKPLTPYLLGVFVLLSASGLILSRLTNEYIVLIAVIVIEFIILSIIMLHVYNKYLKPIHNAVKTVGELAQGNYRARVHGVTEGMTADLNKNINKLARNLSELSIQEEIKAKQLRTVLNNTDSGLALIDEKGYIHIINRKFLKLFGGSKSDYVGYLYYDVISYEKIHQTVQEAFLYEENVKHSFTIPDEIGNRYIEIVGAPIFNERNILKGSVIVLYDITELKRVAIMRKDFVANVSHELQTPITSLRGFAETLLDGNQKERETEKKFIKIIYDESKRLQFLVEDLLTLSTLEKENFRLLLHKVNILGVTKEIQPIIMQKAAAKNIKFTISAEKDYTLMADREKLKQVCLNLINNAISYTPKYGKVSLVVDESDGYIRFQVKDNGIGIEEDDLPRLFERFYRVDKDRSRHTGGTGLGLAIVKHIVEVHKGEIT